MKKPEAEKFLIIVNKIIEENPDVDTCLELIKMLNKHVTFKSAMRDALEPMHQDWIERN